MPTFPGILLTKVGHSLLSLTQSDTGIGHSILLNPCKGYIGLRDTPIHGHQPSTHAGLAADTAEIITIDGQIFTRSVKAVLAEVLLCERAPLSLFVSLSVVRKNKRLCACFNVLVVPVGEGKVTRRAQPSLAQPFWIMLAQQCCRAGPIWESQPRLLLHSTSCMETCAVL